jgi:TonB family protein
MCQGAARSSDSGSARLEGTVQKTHRRVFGRGGPHRGEGPQQAAGTESLVTRELDPRLLAQLRDLQEWAIQSRRQSDGSQPRSAQPAVETEAETHEPQAETHETEAETHEPQVETHEHAAPRAALQPAAIPRVEPAPRPVPPIMTRPPARPGRWAAIAALLLLVALDAYLMTRARRHDDPEAAIGATQGGRVGALLTTRPSGRLASQLPTPAGPAPSGSPSAVTPISPAPASLAPASRSAAPVPASTASAAAPQTGVAPVSPIPTQAPHPTAGPSAAAPPAAAPRSAATGAPSGQGGAVSARRAPSSRRGALLRPGPGVRPPILLSVPRILHPAAVARRRRTKAGRFELDRRLGALPRIRVVVLVDESGYVTNAEVAGGDTSRVGVDRAALTAAMAARYRPATRYGVPGKMWTRLTFDFQQ